MTAEISSERSVSGSVPPQRKKGAHRAGCAAQGRPGRALGRVQTRGDACRGLEQMGSAGLQGRRGGRAAIPGGGSGEGRRAAALQGAKALRQGQRDGLGPAVLRRNMNREQRGSSWIFIGRRNALLSVVGTPRRRRRRAPGLVRGTGAGCRCGFACCARVEDDVQGLDFI